MTNIIYNQNILEKLQLFAKENNLEIILYKDNKRDILEEGYTSSTVSIPLIIQAEFLLSSTK